MNDALHTEDLDDIDHVSQDSPDVKSQQLPLETHKRTGIMNQVKGLLATSLAGAVLMVAPPAFAEGESAAETKGAPTNQSEEHDGKIRTQFYNRLQLRAPLLNTASGTPRIEAEGTSVLWHNKKPEDIFFGMAGPRIYLDDHGHNWFNLKMGAVSNWFENGNTAAVFSSEGEFSLAKDITTNLEFSYFMGKGEKPRSLAWISVDKWFGPNNQLNVGAHAELEHFDDIFWGLNGGLITKDRSSEGEIQLLFDPKMHEKVVRFVVKFDFPGQTNGNGHGKKKDNHQPQPRHTEPNPHPESGPDHEYLVHKPAEKHAETEKKKPNTAHVTNERCEEPKIGPVIGQNNGGTVHTIRPDWNAPWLKNSGGTYITYQPQFKPSAPSTNTTLKLEKPLY